MSFAGGFLDNGLENTVLCNDAQVVAEDLRGEEVHVAYCDPPYNQHPYGSNYHVLNSIALWDKPALSKTITRGTKSAIRTDWRTLRRSAYNHLGDATRAYRRLIEAVNAHFILTSYSTDGTIPLEDLLAANSERGDVHLEMKGYKRYRVSSQRFSEKPLNVEFVIVLDTHRKSARGPEELADAIRSAEAKILKGHPECADPLHSEMTLFS